MLNTAEGSTGHGKRGNMARKRYQRGSVILRGKHVKMWIGRYLADEVVDGVVSRVHKSVVLGTREQYPTKPLALRALEPYLAKVNAAEYRPEQVVTFAQFVEKWKETQKSQYKPSTWSDRNSALKCYLIPEFGKLRFPELTPERIQRYIIERVPVKRARNVVMTLRCVWKVAKAWRYVDAELETIHWPKYEVAEARCFTVDEIRRIIDAAIEPFKTMYWMAAETGVRAGELLSLRYNDLAVKEQVLTVKRSVWNGQLGTPKTAQGIRVFSISAMLADRVGKMAEFHQPNDYLFATSKGTPFQHNNVLHRELHPLLATLKIPKGGFHAFRHGNATMLDHLHATDAVKKSRIGHSSLLTTKRYEHVVGTDDRSMSDGVGNLLTAKVAGAGR